MGWVVNATPRPLYPRETRYPLYRRLGKPQGRSGRRKISPHRDSTPNRTAPSESLYRLRSPGPPSSSEYTSKSEGREGETFQTTQCFSDIDRILHKTSPLIFPVPEARRSFSDQSMWDLRQTKWHRNTFFSSWYFRFALSVSFHQCSTLIVIRIVSYKKDERVKLGGTLKQTYFYSDLGKATVRNSQSNSSTLHFTPQTFSKLPPHPNTSRT